MPSHISVRPIRAALLIVRTIAILPAGGIELCLYFQPADTKKDRSWFYAGDGGAWLVNRWEQWVSK